MIDRTSAVRRVLLGAVFAATFAAGGLVWPAAASARQDAAAQDGSGDHVGKHGGKLRAQVEHMLTVAGATSEQKAKVHEILKAARQQAAPLRQKLTATHQELGRLLTAPKIDRAAIERVRAQHVAASDQSGRIMVKAFADAAEVLTPEQRAKIAGAMAERHHAPRP